MHFIDSHCHIDFVTFDNDRKTILSHCQQLGINDIIVPAVTANKWDSLIATCHADDMLHYALGLHPMFMAEHQADHISQLEQYVNQHSPIAIGEIGLDFYNDHHDKESQITLLIEQLKIAQKFDLPIILHVRKAHDEMTQLLKRYPVKGGVVHAFSGSQQQADNYIKQGMLFGIGGACTYPQANRLRNMIAQLPLTSLVLETDAPDMPLSGQQGQPNSPENIRLIADTISELRQQDIVEIANTTTENCKRLFHL